MRKIFKKGYFCGSVPEGFNSLYTAKTLNFAASGLLGIFMPIFLYNLFDSNFQLVMMWYLTGILLYLALIPYGAQFLDQFGFRKALQVSALVGALHYVVFYFMNKETALWLIPTSIITLTIWRMTYWLPYHIKFAQFTEKKNRGKQLSLMLATASLLGIFAPVIAGAIITHLEFKILFIITIVLLLASAIPYITIPRTHEKYTWSYRKTWKQLFAKKNRTLVVPLVADGAENAVGIIIWPIFIFEILNGNYFEVGAISTLIIGSTVIIQLVTGKYVDGKIKKEYMLKLGSIMYSLGWILKIFVATSFHIFAAGAYHSVMKVFTRTPFDTLVYEIAADQGHYIDEFTALREMAIGVGRVIMLIIAVVVSLYASIAWTFALAAVASLGLNILYSKHVVLDNK